MCIATSGPGATNLVTPIATAYMDSTPIVFITGNVPQSLMGTDSFQEADISGMTMPVTKHNYLVTRVEKLADIVREAFFIASSGRPGPVLIDIPKDVQIAETEYEPAAGEALIPKLSMKHPTVQLRLEGEALERYKVKAAPRLEQAARLIAEAQKPLIYCGGGVILSGAERELAAFADLVDAPVVSTLMGLGAVPADNPRMLGMLGMHGTHAANIAMQRCDLLIAVGVRFSDRALGNAETFAAQAKVLHIDIDRAEIKVGDIVCVVGGGAIGLLLVQLARLAGAAKVVLSEPNEARRKVAKELGADLCINPLEDGYYEKFLAFVGGDGADVIIECAGNHAAVESAFKFARRGATILLFSVPKVEATYEVPLFDVYQKELTIKGTFVNPDTHLRAVELINSGRIQIAPIITHTFTLDELPEAIAMQMSAEAIKVIVKA